MAETKKKSLFSKIVSKLTSGTSSNIEELEGRLVSLVRDLPLCGETPWKLEEVERLLSVGAPVSSRSHLEQCTVLHYACLNVDLATVQLLIDHGADVNALGEHNYTPLHIVASKSSQSSPALIQLLHENGALLEARDFVNKTPLCLSAQLCDTSNSRMLLSLGANLHPPNVRHRPINFAIRSGRLEQILLFLKYGDSFEDSFSMLKILPDAYKHCVNFEVIKLFVEAGLKVDVNQLIEDKFIYCREWPDNYIEWLSNPLPLKMLCLQTIRRSVGRDKLENISMLNLPVKLKQRLMYEAEGFDFEMKKDSKYLNIYEHDSKGPSIRGQDRLYHCCH